MAFSLLGNGRSCKLRKPAACTVAVTIVFVILITAVLALAGEWLILVSVCSI